VGTLGDCITPAADPICLNQSDQSVPDREAKRAREAPQHDPTEVAPGDLPDSASPHPLSGENASVPITKDPEDNPNNQFPTVPSNNHTAISHGPKFTALDSHTQNQIRKIHQNLCCSWLCEDTAGPKRRSVLSQILHARCVMSTNIPRPLDLESCQNLETSMTWSHSMVQNGPIHMANNIHSTISLTQPQMIMLQFHTNNKSQRV
jgi:hypothetical protein